MRWFPRPASAEALVLLPPSDPWTSARAYEHLADAAAAEWQHRVGVVGPVDGSAKSTTRLLSTRGWVMKTRVDQADVNIELVKARLEAERTALMRCALAHPDKRWAVMQVEGHWYPLTICPELKTLRQREQLDDRLAGWAQMIQLALDVHARRGCGLDLNPSNFGTTADGALSYLDDELYGELTASNVAGAIAARIPEEDAVPPMGWRAWGESLRRTLRIEPMGWPELEEEVRCYPLPDRYRAHRSALLDGMAPRRERRSRGERTCVLGDVHGNLAALEAVLADARAEGADAYLFLGDVIGYGPQPLECVRRIAELTPAIVLRGNHDHAIGSGDLEVGMNHLARATAAWTRDALGAADRAWLAGLPIEHVGESWIAVHGAPRDPRRFLAYVYELTYEDNLRHLRDQDLSVCFHGHTHVQIAYAEAARAPIKLRALSGFPLLRGGRYLVNPGSVGQPRDGDRRAAYALWDRRSGEVRFRRVAYDVELTIRALRAAGLPPQLETRLRAAT
jgi:diadenosine tetraphosphatase ApaH/serine/threonine PP2A family protein phosphatase